MSWLDDSVNALSLLGATVILILTVAVAGKYIKQMKDDTSEGELSEENWDGIGEYKNELPLGWALAFIGTIVWGIWYWFFGYPLNAYSQIGEWNEEVKSYQERFESKWANADEETLQAMGESLFLVQCAPCHGETAEGMDNKAANLTHRMDAASVAHVIEYGSAGIGKAEGQLGYPMGMMPDRNGIINMNTGMPISDEHIQKIANYIETGMPSSDSEANELFVGYCSACHGADGKGMGGMAPNLVEYDQTIINAVLDNGKKGVIGSMPAFKGRLSDVQYQALQAYIASIKE